ncbi:peptidoglycan recognition family protein [Kitasatospora sp. NPDC005748]|uniref:peptidoglycan recognition protein family protein n=1 Tax=Kitasatospora sp. NPDC005748 TaxID=3157063 RepID=UPI0034080691
MKLVTRADLGWPASAAPLQATTLGVKVHYEGTPVSVSLLSDHGACLREWQNIRASHLANTAENYSDVAYNYAACPHGYLLEGRGIGRRTGANGNQDLNRAHYAIVGLVGDSGLTQPTAAMLGAIRDGIELLRAHGAGQEIKGHRDGYATSCPGGPLYAWVEAGAPRPTTTTPAPTPAPTPSEEDDMPLTDADLARIRGVLTSQEVLADIAVAVRRYEEGGPSMVELLDEIPQRVWDHKLPRLRDDWTKDGDLEAYWYVAGKDVSDRSVAQQFAELKALLGAQSAAITALAHQVTAGTPVDADALIAQIKAAIAGIEVHLTTAGTPAPKES